MNPFAILSKWFGWQPNPFDELLKYDALPQGDEAGAVSPGLHVGACEVYYTGAEPGRSCVHFNHVSTPGKERWRRRRQRTARQRNFSAVKRKKAHS